MSGIAAGGRTLELCDGTYAVACGGAAYPGASCRESRPADDYDTKWIVSG